MRHPTCPDIGHLRSLLEEGAGSGESLDLTAHLETCADCQQTLETLAADPGAWEDAARGLEKRVRKEPALRGVVRRLKRLEVPAAEDDRSFLRPADQPGLLGMLGPYEVEKEIGRGGMGVVLKARDPALNRVVALKVLAPHLAASATARQRFVREGRSAAAVCHEHLVTIYSVNEADGLPYLVMQYVAGESLQDRLDRIGPLEIEEVVRLGAQTASGLVAAHAHKLIHRDIKPANLLLEAREDEPGACVGMGGLAPQPGPLAPRVKITDFGLARLTDDVQLTQNGVLAGTPEYMAPEQARGELVDHRADLFSLGSVLYAMATGESPFRGQTTLALIRQVSEETPVPMRTLNPNVPDWLETLVARLMAKDPAERFQSAAEVAALLGSYLAHLRQPQVPAPELPAVATASCPGQSVISSDRGGSALLPRLVGWATGVVLTLVFLWIAHWLIGGNPGTSAGTGYAQLYHASFKGKSGNQEDFQLCGPEADKCVRFEPEGLHITLPRGWNGVRADTGVRLYHPVKGDFEITVNYDILAEPTPKEAGDQESRITLWIRLAKESLAVGTVSRRVQAKGGTQHVAWMTAPSETTGENQERAKGVSTGAKSGRLRLTRTDAVLSYWIAEGDANDFGLVQKYRFGAEDVDYIQIAGSTGNAKSLLEVRLSDLSIRMEPLPGGPVGVSVPAAGRRWLIPATIIGLIIALSFAGMVWFLVRHRGRLPRIGGRPAVPGNQPKPGMLTSPLAFACSACGKGIKAKAELAGKKVKCPQCGKSLLAPPPTGKGQQ